MRTYIQIAVCLFVSVSPSKFVCLCDSRLYSLLANSIVFLVFYSSFSSSCVFGAFAHARLPPPVVAVVMAAPVRRTNQPGSQLVTLFSCCYYNCSHSPISQLYAAPPTATTIPCTLRGHRAGFRRVACRSWAGLPPGCPPLPARVC